MDFDTDIQLIEMVIEKMNLQSMTEPLNKVVEYYREAVRENNQEVAEYIARIVHGIAREIQNVIILNQGSVGCVSEVAEQITDSLRSLKCCAAIEGDCTVLKWLHDRGETFGKDDIEGAIASDDLETVEFLVKECGTQLTSEAMDYAAENGQLETMEWLAERGVNCSSETLNLAAGAGDIEVMEWLKARGCRATKKALLNAVENGDPKMVSWLSKNRSLFTEPITESMFRRMRKKAANKKAENDSFDRFLEGRTINITL